MEHQPVELRVLLFCDKCVGSFTSPPDHITLKMQEKGKKGYRPYLRRLEPIYNNNLQMSLQSQHFLLSYFVRP